MYQNIYILKKIIMHGRIIRYAVMYYCTFYMSLCQAKGTVDMCAHPRSLITLRRAVYGQEMARLIRLF